MENSKRIQRAIKKLEKLEESMEFYTNGNNEYKKDFEELRDLIDELGLDKKEDHTRLAKKLKAHWEALEKSEET
jgi:hypothetical protein